MLYIVDIFWQRVTTRHLTLFDTIFDPARWREHPGICWHRNWCPSARRIFAWLWADFQLSTDGSDTVGIRNIATIWPMASKSSICISLMGSPQRKEDTWWSDVDEMIMWRWSVDLMMIWRWRWSEKADDDWWWSNHDLVMIWRLSHFHQWLDDDLMTI